MKSNWNVRLSKQMPVLLDTNVVIYELDEKLKELFFEEQRDDDLFI